MNKYLLASVSLAALIVGGVLHAADNKTTVQPDPNWPFNSEAKMENAIREHAADPKATYYVIMRAWELHKSAQATLVYRQLLMKDPDDPYLESAYAFCQMLSYSNLSGNVATDPPDADRGKADALQMDAEYYRDKAFKAKPNDLYILLERGIDFAYQYQDSRSNDQIDAATCLQKAVDLAPNWGIAHVWYGNCLINAAGQRNMKELSTKALSEYELAVKLDPGLQVQSLEGEAASYGNLNQNAAALKCLNTAFAINPELKENEGLMRLKQDYSKP